MIVTPCTYRNRPRRDRPGTWRGRLAAACLAALAACLPLSAQDSGDLNPDDVIGTLVMVDESTPAVLDLLEKLTGKVILRPQNLQPQKINFDSRGPLTREQAITALESLLSMNGLALVELDETFARAVQSSVPINPFTPEIITETDLRAPPSQKVFSKIYRFHYLTLDQVLEILPSFTTPNAPAPVPLRKSDSVMVTDALSNLQRLETIFSELDQPKSFDDKIIFIPLKFVNSVEIQNQLQRLAESSLSPYLGGNTTFAADERTNQLIVFTHPANEGLIRDLVAQFDIDVAPLTRNEVFYIKHADAPEVAGLIEQVITGQRQVRQQEQRGSRTTRTAATQQAQAAQQPQAPAAANAQAGEAGAPNLQFSDYVGIVADERSNAIVAYGTPTDLQYLSELIDQIDILLAQVRIEVIITEVNLGDQIDRGIEAFGIDFNVAGENGFPGANEVGFDVSGRAFDLAGTVKEFSIQSVFETAQTNSDVEILSAPTIVTTHNQEAIINVSESRPVITSVQSDATNVSSTRSNVQFRDIGIQLTVKPLIGSNGIVQMEIQQTVETVTGTTIIDGNEQPIIGKREATSFVSVGDQEIVVLGGLQESSFSETHGRVAVFGYIPIVGELFRNKTRQDRVRELIIFIKPYILENSAASRDEAVRMINRGNTRDTIEGFLNEGIRIDRKEHRDKGPTMDLWNWVSDPFQNEEDEAVDRPDFKLRIPEEPAPPQANP